VRPVALSPADMLTQYVQGAGAPAKDPTAPASSSSMDVMPLLVLAVVAWALLS